MPRPDQLPDFEGGEAIERELKDKLSNLWRGVSGDGGGGLMAGMVVDAASGRFSKFTEAGREQTGETALMVTWTMKRGSSMLDCMRGPFLNHIVRLEVRHDSGPALSELALQRVANVVAQVQRRIVELHNTAEQRTGDEAIREKLEEFFCHPPLEELEDIGEGSFMVKMIIDAASGRLSRLTHDDSNLSPGEASYAAVWSISNNKPQSLLLTFRNGQPPSALAGDRISDAAIQARARFES